MIAAHERAVDAGIAYLEANAGHARAGKGGVRRVATSGFIVAKFRHRTARTTDPDRVGDPQLHTHCAILNRVRTVEGKWRTLDGAAIYAHAHAAGALYATVLEQELSNELAVSWMAPDGRVPMREIDGVDQEVCAALSSRRAQVLEHYDALDAQWRAVNGRSPTRAEKAGLLDDAAVRSRLGKVKGDGVDPHKRWRASITPTQQQSIANAVRRSEVSNGGRLPAGSQAITTAVFESLHGQRSWWTRVHLFAEVARLIDTPTVEAIEVEVERLAGLCVNLEVDTDHEYAQLDRTKFTSHDILAAERRVLTAANTPAPWTVTVDEAVTVGLGDDQVEAVAAICHGDTAVTTVIGPAGAGKTTMLKAVSSAFTQAQRPVTVLALSAVAAQVVTEETGMPANTIAAWKVGSVTLPRDGLVLVDEASMVPTMTLDQLVRVASAYQCRVAFVGDYAQMGAPEAGGLLRDLAGERSAVHMTAVRRFVNDWERAASKLLRRRDADVADTYDDHGRIVATDEANAVESVVDAWVLDTASGLNSMIIVDTAEQAADVSSRCQQHLVTGNQLGGAVGEAADGNNLRLGDLIQSRKNTRTLVTSDRRRVLNRDVWKITGYDEHGGIIATHTRRGTTAEFTGDYTRRHVVLAYATTTAGAQGRTVDTGHTLITPRTNAAALYVAMTRGRHSNHAHVIRDGHDHQEFGIGVLSARDAFAAAIQRSPEGQLSATSIRARWAAGRADRHTARDADRAHQAAAAWWAARQQRVDSTSAAALAGHHHHVLAILETVDATRWESLVTAAHSATDWQQPDAGGRFVTTLNDLNRARRPSSTTPGAPDADDTTGPRRTPVADEPPAASTSLTATPVLDTNAGEPGNDPNDGDEPSVDDLPTKTPRPGGATRDAATRWWTHKAPTLAAPTALTVDQHHQVVALLTRVDRNHWHDIIDSAAAATVWPARSAGDHFVAHLTTMAQQVGVADHSPAQRWWATTYRAISDPNATRALNGHAEQIIGVLEQLPQATWSAQVTRGLSRVDWYHPDAVATFIAHLADHTTPVKSAPPTVARQPQSPTYDR